MTMNAKSAVLNVEIKLKINERKKINSDFFFLLDPTEFSEKKEGILLTIYTFHSVLRKN